MTALHPKIPEPTIRVNVDPANPGQFFACCGLLELCDRLWTGAQGWFTRDQFVVAPGAAKAGSRTLREMLDAAVNTSLEQLDTNDDRSSPMRLGDPFHVRLDWWKDARTSGNRLKVWAGSMRPVRIAKAMQSALKDSAAQTEALFDFAAVVFDALETDKKVEPFYFDSRRGSNAQSRDIGFAPDALQMQTAAYPAVEFFCLVGLQRCRPMLTDAPRVFDYHTWTIPCLPEMLPAAVSGLLGPQRGLRYRFENAFRTDQRKHKSFLPAQLLGGAR